MWPVSQRFLDAVGTNHAVKIQVTIGPLYGVGVDITEWVTGGSVSVDRRRAVKRTCDLTIVNPDGDLIPGVGQDSFNPASGQILTISRGVMFDDGTTELAPLGMFRVTSAPVSEGADGTKMQVAGSDLSWVVARSVFPAPFGVADGHTVPEAIEAILVDRVPTHQTRITDSTFTLPQLVWGVGSDQVTDPWTVVTDLAEDAGFEIYFDQVGVCVTAVETSQGTTATVRYGPEDLRVVLDAERGWDGEKLFNGVVVIAENEALPNPIRVERWDVTAGSLTNANGPFGKIPDIITSNTISSEAAALAAALQRLKRNLGIGAALKWSQVVNPALDAGDVVQVSRPSLGVEDEVYVLDALTIPLDAAGVMTAEGRVLAQAVLELSDDV